MMKNRQEKQPVVYLDETWVNSHDGKRKSWFEKDPTAGGTKGGVQKPSGKGSCLIILHAGGEKGWIDGVELVFTSKKSTGDYYVKMNSENFEEWFQDTLLPKLESNSIIEMDNASYHIRYLQRYPQRVVINK